MSIDKYSDPFPTRIRNLLDETKTSQSKLAESVGVTRQAISAYANGDAVPTIDKFQKIAEFFDVSFDYLLGKSDSKKRENYLVSRQLGLNDLAIEAIFQLQDNCVPFSGEDAIKTLNNIIPFLYSIIKDILTCSEAYKNKPDIQHAEDMSRDFLDTLTDEQKRIIAAHKVFIVSAQKYIDLCIDEGVKHFLEMFYTLSGIPVTYSSYNELSLKSMTVDPSFFYYKDEK